MFDKNLVVSYCREKVEAAHWASKQLSQKKDPVFADAWLLRRTLDERAHEGMAEFPVATTEDS